MVLMGVVGSDGMTSGRDLAAGAEVSRVVAVGGMVEAGWAGMNALL